MAVNDVRKMPQQGTRNILLNKEAIVIDMDEPGIEGSKKLDEGNSEVWVKPLKGGDFAVILFNLGDPVLKTIQIFLIFTLLTCAIFGQATQSVTKQVPPGAQNTRVLQRQYPPQPTRKEVAIMEAALKYNKDPKSTLWPAHDPVLIKQDSVFYLFTTGGGVSSSTDLINWKQEKPVFDQSPSWITDDLIPGFQGGRGYWAPDIQLVNGTYYLYYSYSAFGKNTSVIGVATNKTLHPDSPDFKWVDHGLVVQSVPNRDMWNAIDPNLIMDRNQGWLVFGSFWGGIKLVKLSTDLLSVDKPEVWYTVARRPRTFALDDTDPGDGTIEGPFIYKHFQYYYLFVSLDYCCRGVSSNYNVVVGRSRNVEGPYVDKGGKLLSRGGGTPMAKGNEIWAGVGHTGHYNIDGKSIMIMHGYDKRDNGRSKLIIREMKWDRADWPSIDL
jgi:arabinan endo-1,5-alpha-L-arabinosidase